MCCWNITLKSVNNAYVRTYTQRIENQEEDTDLISLISICLVGHVLPVFIFHRPLTLYFHFIRVITLLTCLISSLAYSVRQFE